nr:hypothetical protein [Tanacetum cinerariifolium]
MIYKKNVDYAELIWEDFQYQIKCKGKGKGPTRKKKADTPAPKEKKNKNAPRKKSFITTKDNILPDPDEALKLGESISLTEKAANEEIAKEEKTEEDKVDDEQAGIDQAGIKQDRDKELVDDQARSKQAGGAQANVVVHESVVPNPSSSLTLSSAEYSNHFINKNHDVSMTDILKESTEIKIQIMMDVPIH